MEPELQNKSTQPIEQHPLRLLSNAKGNKKSEYLSAACLGKLLFERAPDDFLWTNTGEYLEIIAKNCLETINQLIQNNSQVEITELRTHTSTQNNTTDSNLAFSIALIDRPFVVDTIRATAERFRLEIKSLLHPILNLENEKKVSISFLCLEDGIEENKKTEFKNQLYNCLQALVIATKDYPEIYTQADELKHLLQEEDKESEVAKFVEWMQTSGFIFLASKKHWGWINEGKSLTQELGILTVESSELHEQTHTLEKEIEQFKNSNALYRFTKIPCISPVVRPVYLCAFIFRPDLGSDKLFVFIGLITLNASGSDCTNIPLIKEKFAEIADLDESILGSHDYKEAKNIFNNFPKSDLFWFSSQALLENINLIREVGLFGKTRVTTGIDPSRNFAVALVLMPEERYFDTTRATIRRYLENLFEAQQEHSECRVASIDDSIVRLHFTLKNLAQFTQEDLAQMEKEIEETISKLSYTWDDKFRIALEKRRPMQKAIQLFSIYRSAFDSAYKATNSPKQALKDISYIHKLSKDSPLCAAIEDIGENLYTLKLYKLGGGFTLSSIVPTIENAGFVAISETSTELVKDNSLIATIYSVRIERESTKTLKFETLESTLIPGLIDIFNGDAQNDPLNALLIEPGLSVKDIALIRAIKQYLVQIKLPTARRSYNQAFCENPSLSALLVQIFKTKFDPSQKYTKDEDRDRTVRVLSARYIKNLKQVKKLSSDRALRAAINAVEAMTRTSFFVKKEDNFRIAFKIDCSKIAAIPEPHPDREFFVCSPKLEGTHLRSAKVARGGLRWSSRLEDYRTEVLGLMKTQVVKNAIIVPAGAKGGFIVKNPNTSHPELAKQVEEAYRSFIRSLLELSDSYNKSGEIVKPNSCIIHDDDDSYLVVAADRGTANFSDIANELAIKEFDFWLGDAFASGGKNGYDHKKYGITALGAWEAVKLHFREMGHDVETQGCSLIGIGDMSGDVFGNGLLACDKFKLIAAFNHKHIFLDPNPDPNNSYLERKRLFELEKSSWSDYRQDTISSGGGVFDREQKEISLSTEARETLGTKLKVVNGDELISIILKSPVDLIWNGGIGTYVKSNSETHAEASDRANDDVRINASELRAKVIGEGGNLGLTQKARNDFAIAGGAINTDFIDNSGGVDLSDYEVNLKILWKQAVETGRLTAERRNILLEVFAPQACQRVLTRNRSQSLAISIARERGIRFQHIQKDYNQLVDAHISKNKGNLPSIKILKERANTYQGLTRPELAILIAEAKLSVYSSLLKYPIEEEIAFKKFLINYFPKPLQEEFSNEIEAHPLKREIISSQLSNLLVETMGGTFFFSILEINACNELSLAKAFVWAYEIVNAEQMLETIKSLDTATQHEVYRDLFLCISHAIETTTTWLLEENTHTTCYTNSIELLKEPFQKLLKNIEQANFSSQYGFFSNKTTDYLDQAENKLLAKSFSTVKDSAIMLDIVALSLEQQVDENVVLSAYSALIKELCVLELIESVEKIMPANKWETKAQLRLSFQLRKLLRQLCKNYLCFASAQLLSSDEKFTGNNKEIMVKFINEKNQLTERFISTVSGINKNDLSLASLIVVLQQLESIAQ